MARLKAVVPTLDAVPEPLREFYVEQNGTWVLDIDGGQIDVLRQTIEQQESAIAGRVVEQVAREALAAAGADVDLMAVHVVPRLKVERSGSEFRVSVIGPDGKVRVRDARGTPMDVADLVAELRADRVFGRGFRSTGASGSGTPPVLGPTLPQPIQTIRLSRAQASDARVYREAKERAQREGLTVEIEPG